MYHIYINKSSDWRIKRKATITGEGVKSICQWSPLWLVIVNEPPPWSPEIMVKKVQYGITGLTKTHLWDHF